MIMPVIDNYPDSARHSEEQASSGPDSRDLALQPRENSLAALRSLVVDRVSSPNSKRAYGRAVDKFLAWYQQQDRGPLCKALLQSYRAGLEQQGLGPATVNVHLSPLPPLAGETAGKGR